MARNSKWYPKRWHKKYSSWKTSVAEDNGWSDSYKQQKTHDNYPAAWWTGPEPYRPYRQEGCNVLSQTYYQPGNDFQCINSLVPASVADDHRLTDLFMLADLPHIVRDILALLD